MATFEVGTVFRVADEATPALTKIANQLKKLNELIEETKANLKNLTRGITTDLQLGKSIAEVDKLAKSWENVSKAALGARSAMGEASGVAIAGGGGRRGGGGGHRGPPGFMPNVPVPHARVRVPMPGGHMHVGGSSALLGLGAALGYGVMEDAEVTDAAVRAMQITQTPFTDDNFKRFKDLIQKNSAASGFSPRDVAEGVLGAETQFAGMPYEQRLKTLQEVLPFATAEARFKEGTSLKDSMEAFVGLAHMSGTYDPKQMEDLYRKFAFMSMVTPMPIKQFQTALSYSLPVLGPGGMGMDPSTVAFMTALNQSAGVRSTKAGTWTQAFFESLEPSIGESKKAQAHNKMLREFGFLDAHNKETWKVRGADGQTDWQASLLKLAPQIHELLQRVPESNRLGVMKDIFGKLGGREAGLLNLPQFIAQFAHISELMQNAKTGEAFMKNLSENSPEQKGRMALADLQNVLMDLGNKVMPAVLQALQVLDGTLKAIAAILPQSKAGTLGAKAGAGALLGAGAGWFVPGVGPLLGGAIGGAAGLSLGMGDVLHDKLSQPGSPAPAWMPNPAEGGRVPSPTQSNPWHMPSWINNLISGKPIAAQPVQVHTTLNLDGRAIADSVSERLAEIHAFPGGSANAGAGTGYAPPDFNYSAQ